MHGTCQYLLELFIKTSFGRLSTHMCIPLPTHTHTTLTATNSSLHNFIPVKKARNNVCFSVSTVTVSTDQSVHCVAGHNLVVVNVNKLCIRFWEVRSLRKLTATVSVVAHLQAIYKEALKIQTIYTREN